MKVASPPSHDRPARRVCHGGDGVRGPAARCRRFVCFFGFRENLVDSARYFFPRNVSFRFVSVPFSSRVSLLIFDGPARLRLRATGSPMVTPMDGCALPSSYVLPSSRRPVPREFTVRRTMTQPTAKPDGCTLGVSKNSAACTFFPHHYTVCDGFVTPGGRWAHFTVNKPKRAPF